jgi:hypothetical protein
MTLRTAVLLGLFFLTTPAAAQTRDGRFLVSGNIGRAEITPNHGNFLYGARIGVEIHSTPLYGVNLGVSTGGFTDTRTVSGTSTEQRFTMVLAECLLTKVDESGFYGGVRVGPGMISAASSGAFGLIEGSATSLLYGGTVGYEFPFLGQLWINTEGSYLGITGGKMKFSGGAEADYNGNGTLLIQAGFNYHF